MDTNAVNRIFESMVQPVTNEVEFEVVNVPDTYTSIDETPIVELESTKDPESVWLEISRYIAALENKKEAIEETEVKCVGISPQQAKAKLSSFIDHLHYYIACESKKEFLISDTKNIIIIFEGSVLSVAAQALAQALVSGCAVILLGYEKFSLTAQLLRKIWVEAELCEGTFQVRTDFPESLLKTEPALKIFVGGQLVDGPHYQSLKPYFMNGYSTPLLVLDGADIESVVSVVRDKAHLFRHVEPWALSVIVIQESQLPEFKELILQRPNVPDINEPSPSVMREQIEHIKRYHLENNPAEVHYLAQYRYIVFGTQPTRVTRLWYHDLNGQPLYVLPVRTAAEAVAKANHYGSGYAAAVFTEDGSLSQFVAEKLRASTVWINTIGQLHPTAPLPFQVVNTSTLGHCQLSTYQSSDNIFNLLRFGSVIPLIEAEETRPSAEEEPQEFSQEVLVKVKAAVEAQPVWEALGGLERSKLFHKLYNSAKSRIPEEARTLPTPRQNRPVDMEVGENGGPSRPCTVQLENFVEETGTQVSENLRRASGYLKRTTVSADSITSNQENGTSITTNLQPCGVVGIYVDNSKCCAHARKQIIMTSGGRHKLYVGKGDDEAVIEAIQGAIAYGNSCVVILADDSDYQLIDLLYGSSSCLPKGVVNIIKSKDPVHWISLVKHEQVKCLWHTDVLLRKEHELLKNVEAKYSKRVWIGVSHELRKIKTGTGVSLKPFEPHATIRKHVWRITPAN